MASALQTETGSRAQQRLRPPTSCAQKKGVDIPNGPRQPATGPTIQPMASNWAAITPIQPVDEQRSPDKRRTRTVLPAQIFRHRVYRVSLLETFGNPSGDDQASAPHSQDRRFEADRRRQTANSQGRRGPDDCRPRLPTGQKKGSAGRLRNSRRPADRPGMPQAGPATAVRYAMMIAARINPASGAGLSRKAFPYLSEEAGRRGQYPSQPPPPGLR